MATRKPASRRSVSAKVLNDIEAEQTSSVSTKDKEKESARRVQALGDLQDFNLADVVKGVTDTSLKVNEVFSDLQQEIVQAGSTYQNLNVAIDAKTEELQSLYDKEVVASSLQQLLEKFKRTEEELRAKAQKSERDALEASQQLEKTRQREESDFKFKRDVDRRTEKDQYEQEQAKKRAAFLAEEQQIRSSLDARDAAITAREAEFAALKLEHEKFPEILKKEKDAAVSIAVNVAKKDLTHEFSLTKKDLESQLALANQRNSTLSEQLKGSSEEVTRLRDAINSAQERVVEIAKSSFEAQSGKDALSAVTQAVGQQKENSKK